MRVSDVLSISWGVQWGIQVNVREDKLLQFKGKKIMYYEKRIIIRQLVHEMRIIVSI